VQAWKDFPELRYDVDNGITYCVRCHRLVEEIMKTFVKALTENFCNGVTATARMMAFADAKVDMETRAGKLMKLAEAKAA
jgi:hypothetical protein